MCREDCLFFINSLLYTYNPRLEIPHIPFVTYPFQDEYILNIIRHIERGEDVFTEKSRDMGVTWMILAVFLWGWLFREWAFKIGSRKMEYVDRSGDMDSLFEKVRYMISRLPAWMLPEKFKTERGTIYNSMAKIAHPIHMNTITGEATNPNFGRGGRCKAVLYDEFAFWGCAEEAWKGGADTTNCRIVVSTTNGMHTKFAELKHDKTLKINRYRLHWSQHPLKTKEWYLLECQRRTAQEIAQELDISYEASASERVYEEFDMVKIGNGPEFDYNHSLPLYVFWDFGEGGPDPTSMIWCQFDSQEGLRIIDEYELAGRDINFFGTLVSGLQDSTFLYDEDAVVGIGRRRFWKRGIHVGDPYNGRKTTFVGQTSIEKELMKHGIRMNLDKGSNSTLERIKITKLFVRNMRVHSRCVKFIQAMKCSRWPKAGGSMDRTSAIKKPVHDASSHMRTALEFGCEYLSGYRTSGVKNRFYKTTNSYSGYKDAYKSLLKR